MENRFHINFSTGGTQRALEQPFLLEGQAVYVMPHIGITLSTEPSAIESLIASPPPWMVAFESNVVRNFPYSASSR